MQVPLWGGRATSSPGPKPRKSRRDFTAFDNRPSRRHYWSRSLLKERCHLYSMARACSRRGRSASVVCCSCLEAACESVLEEGLFSCSG